MVDIGQAQGRRPVFHDLDLVPVQNKLCCTGSKLSYLGERSEPRENARASGEALRGRGKKNYE